MSSDTTLLTVDLEISGCKTAHDLQLFGGALPCIRGVTQARPSAAGRPIAVSFQTDRVALVQFARAVRAMGAHLDSIDGKSAVDSVSWKQS